MVNPPGLIHVARAANLSQVDYMGVSRYSTNIRGEIAVGLPDVHCERDFLLGVAWHIAALLKLKSSPTLFCPAAATASWDTICAVSDNSIDFYMLDDVPRQIAPMQKEIPIKPETAKWIELYCMNAYELRNRNNSRRFGLAFNNMYTWNHTTDLRIALANIWIGLEALFGKREDKNATQGLAERISDWIPSRRDIDIFELYSQRCDAVHGRYLDDEEINHAIKKSETLLKLSIIKCIETGTKTLPDWKP